jgi:hypothetical protein
MTATDCVALARSLGEHYQRTGARWTMDREVSHAPLSQPVSVRAETRATMTSHHRYLSILRGRLPRAAGVAALGVPAAHATACATEVTVGTATAAAERALDEQLRASCALDQQDALTGVRRRGHMVFKIIAFGLVACCMSCADERPDISTDGLGRVCPASGCAPGQECVTGIGPNADISTCQIRCQSDADCPKGTECQLPPVLPDALSNICGES